MHSIARLSELPCQRTVFTTKSNSIISNIKRVVPLPSQRVRAPPRRAVRDRAYRHRDRRAQRREAAQQSAILPSRTRGTALSISARSLVDEPGNGTLRGQRRVARKKFRRKRSIHVPPYVPHSTQSLRGGHIAQPPGNKYLPRPQRAPMTSAHAQHCRSAAC